MTNVSASILVLIIWYAIFILEGIAVLICVRLALKAPHLGNHFFQRMERSLARLARRKRLAVLVVGIAALTGRALLLPVLPIREPAITDEFSHLLAADTFASGRLTSPTHPLWVYFETMHVNQQPTYMSMYSPGQGLVLAAGKRLAGSPWAGVWISSALMCAAICWMLQGWLPPVWALLGGLIAIVRIGLFSYWVNSYWGGAVAAIGGALVLGALPRLVKRRRVWDSVLLALGVVIVANSRPYEGVFLCLPVAAYLLVWMLGKRRPRPAVLIWKVIAPAALILAAGGAAIGYYNWRLTGNPLRLPYQVNREAYVSGRYFPWESFNPKPVYRHASMRDFYLKWQAQTAQEAMSLPGFVKNALQNVGFFWMFYLGPLLTLPLVMMPRVLRDRRVRFLVVAGGVVALGLGLNLWFLAHYAAPATALFYALLLQGLRHLRFCGGRRLSPGMFLTRSVPLLCIVMVAVRLAAQPLSFYMPIDHPATWFSTRQGNFARAKMMAQLNGLPGRHLVLVRYLPNHDWFGEWVYNDADVDGSRVVWAHDMGPAGNQELLDYFKSRRVWLVEADLKPPRMSPYTQP